MMGEDNPDGDAMSPPTHFAIRACCLICGHAGIDMENKTFSKPAMCTRAVDNHCDDFTMRDFGYPVKHVDVADELFDGYYCNYSEANAGKCANNNTLCLECFGPTTCPYLAMKKIEGVE